MSETGTETNWRNLLAAILLQAAKDARAGNLMLAAAARHWLAGDGAALASDFIDIPESRLMAWVHGLNPLPWERVCYFLFDVVETLRERLAEAEAEPCPRCGWPDATDTLPANNLPSAMPACPPGGQPDLGEAGGAGGG